MSRRQTYHEPLRDEAIANIACDDQEVLKLEIEFAHAHGAVRGQITTFSRGGAVREPMNGSSVRGGPL